MTLLGAVAKPGQLSIPANTVLDLATALDWGGGLTPVADESRIELKRGGETKIYTLKQLRAKGAAQVALRDGDRINVAASPYAGKQVMVTGEVARPGPVQFPLSGTLDLKTALGMAGGLGDHADANRMTVRRGQRLFSASIANGQAKLMPGDVISVPVSRFAGKAMTVMGQVGRPGEIAFPPDGKLDVLTAVARAGDFGRLANRKRVVVTRRSQQGDQSWRLNLADMAEGKASLFYLQPNDTLSVPIRKF